MRWHNRNAERKRLSTKYPIFSKIILWQWREKLRFPLNNNNNNNKKTVWQPCNCSIRNIKEVFKAKKNDSGLEIGILKKYNVEHMSNKRKHRSMNFIKTLEEIVLQWYYQVSEKITHGMRNSNYKSCIW